MNIKPSFYVLACAILAMAACNNSGEKKTSARADSLMMEVMDGHNEGMAKFGKLKAAQNKVQVIIDSINRLPDATRMALGPYKARMDSLLEQLTAAREGMEKWMKQFKTDSAINDAERRIEYLAEERLKVTRVKESILSSLQKSDSLLKARLSQ